MKPKSRGLRQLVWCDGGASTSDNDTTTLELGVPLVKRCRLGRDVDIYEGFLLETNLALESIAKIELLADGNIIVACSGRVAAALAMLSNRTDAGRGLMWLPFPRLCVAMVGNTFEIIITLQSLGRTFERRKQQCKALLSQRINRDAIGIIEEYISSSEEGRLSVYTSYSYINPSSVPKQMQHWIIRPFEHTVSIAAGRSQHREPLHFSGIVHRLVFYFCAPGNGHPLDILKSVELSLVGTVHTQLSGHAALVTDKFAACAHIPNHAIYTITFEPRRNMIGAKEHSLLALDKIREQILMVHIEPQSEEVDLIIAIEAGNVALYQDSCFALKYSY